jgi:sortase A
VEIVGDVGYERVVLTACHPLYSAAQRIAVFGRLSGVSLFLAEDRRWLDP